jgi:hypothetical protein
MCFLDIYKKIYFVSCLDRHDTSIDPLFFRTRPGLAFGIWAQHDNSKLFHVVLARKKLGRSTIGLGPTRPNFHLDLVLS